MQKLKFQTVREAYEYIYKQIKETLKKEGYSEDKASRAANKKAIENAWKVFNEAKRQNEI